MYDTYVLGGLLVLPVLFIKNNCCTCTKVKIVAKWRNGDPIY